MRILHIINSLATGGAEKLVTETLPLYHEKGIKADVLLLNGTRHPLYLELEAKQCCRIFSLGHGSVYDPRHIGRIIPYLKKYDLVHVHLFPAQYFAIAAKIISFSQTPFVFTEHNTSNRRIQNRWFKAPEKIIYFKYKKIICISGGVKSALQRHAGLPDNKLPVITNGINLKIFKKSTAIRKHEINSGLSDNDFVLMQVAGLRSQKDQPTLIRALLHLPANVKLVLVGDGDLRDACEILVKQLGLEHRVFFLGVRSDVPALYKTCDVGVLSSKWEGFGLVAAEGMAAGKPFIASDVPGLSEVVGGAGLLFPHGDDQQLAAEILKLMKDDKHYETVRRKCQQRAQQYDINTMVDKHIRLYEELVNKK